MEASLVEYLRQFIAFRTVAPAETVKQQCLAWIAETFLRKAPEKIVHGEVEGAPYLSVPHPNTKLLWFAHIDVVPAEDELFTLRLEDGKAFGRGVKDMKGASLPFLMAYRDLLDRGENPPISILLTSDEEIGGRSIPMLLQQGIVAAPAAFTPDTGANPTLVVEHKGAVWARLTLRGKGSHGAWPWEGQNPILALAEALTAICKAFPAGTAEEWHMTVSPTVLNGSDAKNKIPDAASCMLDIRYPPRTYATEKEALNAVRRLLPAGCELTPFVSALPLKTDPNHPMVRLYQEIAEDVTGERIPIGREHGASDARFFQEFGIPAFIHGPRGGNLHHRDEWVSVHSLLHHYAISERLMEALMTR